MPTATRYPTKPLECWPKLKELRREHHRRNVRIMDSGGVVVIGITEQFLGLLAGIGEFATWQYEPRFTARMRDHSDAGKNFEFTESYGFGRDLCNPLRLHLGGVLRGSLQEALKGRKPHFLLQFELCPYSIKVAQVISEILDVPLITMDVISRYRPGPIDQQYYIDQMNEIIERLEQITGRTYDDERMIEATTNEYECSVLWAKICDLTRSVPAPIDYRMCQSLRIPMVLDRDKPEILAFYREVYDEVKERVAGGISARGREDARILFEGYVPFHTPDVLRWPEDYGGVVVGGFMVFLTFGAFGAYPDGRWEPAQLLAERGIKLRTREDALRALIDLYGGDETVRRGGSISLDLRTRPLQMLRRAKDWAADGVIVGAERRCRPQSLTQIEEMALLRENGIPVVDFEPSFCDPREFDGKQVYNRICAFMEGLGLKRLNNSFETRENAD